MVAGKTEVAELEIGAENSGWMAMPLIQKKESRIHWEVEENLVWTQSLKYL